MSAGGGYGGGPAGIDANVGTGMFLGLGASILDLIYGAKRLFGRSDDHYGVHNRNWERTTGFVSPLSRVVLCVLGLVIPALAAPLFVGIIAAAAIYYSGKAIYSIYKAYNNDNEESKRLNKADMKKNIRNAAISLALAIVVIALFASPIGAAAAIGLTVISYVVSASYMIYSLVRFIKSPPTSKVPDRVLPIKAIINVDHDHDVIDQAVQQVNYTQKSKLDFYFRVNRTQVISQISHQDNAEDYLIREIADKIQILENQINQGGLFGNVELNKRQAKKDLLVELRSYLEYLHTLPNEYDARDPIVAFETFAIAAHYDARLDQNLGVTHDQFHQKMRLARQSFFSKVGDFEDILDAYDAYFTYRSRGNQFANGPRPQPVQQAPQQVPAYQPVFMPPPPAYQPPEYQQRPPAYEQPPAGYQPVAYPPAPGYNPY